IGVSLLAGEYLVRAKNSTSNCFGVAEPFTILDTHVDPVITATANNANTNCTGSTAYGSITVSMGASPISDYTINWFEDSGTSVALGTTKGTVLGGSPEKAQNL